MTTAAKMTEPRDARDQVAPFDLPARCVFDSARFALDDLGIDLRAAFDIAPAESLFVLGSCFARDAMHGMLKRVQQRLHTDAAPLLGVALGHKYNAFSIAQALRWTANGGFDERYIIELADGTWFDGHRHPVVYQPSLDTALSPHRAALETTRNELRSASVVAMTLDSIEVWHDDRTDAVLNTPPPVDRISEFENRFRFRRTNHAENRAAILECFELLFAAAPGVRILAAVSPIPIYATFSGEDILVANTYCKSVLHAALIDAVDIARRNGQDVKYCPTFELVMLQPSRDAVWREIDLRGRPDGRHLNETFARGIIAGVAAEQGRMQSEK